MKFNLTSCFLLLAVFYVNVVSAQLSDKEKLLEAYYLMDERRFSEALPLLKEQYEKDKTNANINFNLGVAILNSNDIENKKHALPYLKEASKNASPNYKPYKPKETRAPVETWYYLGIAQHSQHEFDEAKKSFLKFEEYITDKHFLWDEIEQRIRMAQYAQLAVNNPVKIESTNLGEKLNSFYPDFSPVVRIDESAVYFTSRRLREDSSNYNVIDPNDGMLFEDLYVSFNDNDEWGEPVPLNINTDGHEATINLSVDGQTLYIYKDENGNGELFYSELEDDSAGIETWSKPKKFRSDINSDAYETHVTITPDQKLLYYVSDREGGYGGKDIYFCRRLPTGSWALSQNAGPILNTKYDEDGVFMHPDGKTLYFSSNGHSSMGGYDIMYAVLTDSGWTTPKNMGYPINSVDDDVFFVTTPDGKRAYYSSFKGDGYGEKDIYVIQLLDAEESSLTLYRGEFTFINRREPPKGAQVSITNNNTGEFIGVYTPRQRDGQFSAILASNNSYHFVYEADEYEPYEEDIFVPEGASYQEIYKDIKLKPVRVGKGMTGITPSEIQLADVKGALIKNKKILAGKRIVLMDEQEKMLQETETDVAGEFEFKQLDPSKTYLVKVFSNETDVLYNYQLNAENDQGENVIIRELNDTMHIFVPSTYPYEFYGIRAKSIAGRVKSGDEPVSGLSVRLEDDFKNLIQRETTDKYGEFNFTKLDLDKSYRIVFDGEFPEDHTILITDDLGREMKFRRVRDGVYEYVPEKRGRGTKFIGIAKRNGTSLNGISVSLEDGEGNLISQATTDANGEFVFENLSLDQSYKIRFGDDFPDDATLVIRNEFGEKLVFYKTAKGVYEYKPTPKFKLSDIEGTLTSNNLPVKNLKVYLMDKNKVVLNSASTDSVGKFNFYKLDLNKPYYVKFEGNYPEDVKMVIANDEFDLLLFRKIESGLYKYEPIFNAKLINNNNEVLSEETVGEKIEFDYSKLDVNESYMILVDTDFPDDIIIITNDKGEELVFRKTAPGVYEYAPDKEDKLGTQIVGVAKRGGTVLTNLTVNLLDGGDNLLQQATTDANGEFIFKKLDLNKGYKIKFDGDFPDDAIIYIKDEFGNELAFRRNADGTFEYIPGKVKDDKIVGEVKRGGTALTNLKVSLLDGGRNTIQQSTTDANGEFTFSNLDLNEYYLIKFDGDFPDDAILYITNEKGEELTFYKKAPGVYEYIPGGVSKLGTQIKASIKKGGEPFGGFGVQIQNSQNQLIDQTVVDKAGEFEFTRLNLDNRYRIVFDESIPDDAEIIFRNELGQNLIFMKVKDKVYEYVPRPAKYPFKSYTIGVEGNPDYEDTYPKPGELKDVISYYQKYFPYNAKDINESNKEFIQFIDDIAELVKQRGYADIIITSSASKVPTRTWKSNSILTKRRANDSKRLLEKMFRNKGLKENQYNFIDINTLITGPEYNNDHIKNRSTYEKHQYVRIFIK